MKTNTYTSYLFFLVLAFNGNYAQASPNCSSTKLTDDDARILLYVSPVAESARKKGAEVDIKATEPSKKYPASDYFVAAIVSQKLFGKSILGNFAVNKRSGTVNALGNVTEIKGVELMRIQKLMRREHCIHGTKK